MAQRRMFSNRIANSAKFLQMPAESQLLYFHMVLRADDDGIVESYPLMKLLGMAPDNFKVLIAKNFIKQLNEDQVIVITDWIEHNKIRADRKVNSIYLPLLMEIYPQLPIIEPKPRVDVEDNSSRVGGQSTDGIGKVRLGKVSIGKDIYTDNPPVVGKDATDVEILTDYFITIKGNEVERKSRYFKAASELLEMCDKDILKAKQKLDSLKNWAENNGLEYELDTAIKRFLEL